MDCRLGDLLFLAQAIPPGITPQIFILILVNRYAIVLHKILLFKKPVPNLTKFIRKIFLFCIKKLVESVLDQVALTRKLILFLKLLKKIKTLFHFIFIAGVFLQQHCFTKNTINCIQVVLCSDDDSL